MGRVPGCRPLPGPVLRMVGIGAGGHARCVIEAVRSAGTAEIVALLDDDPALVGTTVLGVPVAGAPSLVLDGRFVAREGITAAFDGVGGVGDAGARARAAAWIDGSGLAAPAVVHAGAVVSRSATLAGGVQVLAGAVVNAQSRLGAHAVVNARAVVGHDCVVGGLAHIASGAVLGGGVVVGARAHVGANATVLQGRAIGDGAVVGAGAVVVEDVPAGCTVAGVPARRLRGR